MTDYEAIARQFGVTIEKSPDGFVRFHRGDLFLELASDSFLPIHLLRAELEQTFGPTATTQAEQIVPQVIDLAQRRAKPNASEPAEIQATVTIRGDGSVRVWVDTDEFTEPAHWWWLHTMLAVASYQFLEMEKPLVVIGAGPSESPFPPDGDDK